MKSNVISILSCLLINAFMVTQSHALELAPNSVITRTSSPQPQINENRLEGVVSKITDGKIVINTIPYDFSKQQAKVYDLNGRLSQVDIIKVGMFVSILTNNDKNKPSILEIRLVRK